ncbi:MAG: recombinase family protein [Acetobacteraceae bacterium]|nr:recombinase family protein [Acetobacteraceae bacterium]
MWRVKVATAEYYVKLLSENVKKGQKEKVAQGGYPTKAPLGYKSVGEKGHKSHVIEEDTARYIKEMFTLYATGNYSTMSLGDVMYERGFRTRASGRVVKSKIHVLLSDPFYFGNFVWKGKEHKGIHEPIIDKDLFDQVQAKLTRSNVPYLNKHDKELRGKVLCGACGKTVTWEIQKGQWYGACKQCKAQLGAEKKYVRQEFVEDELLTHATSIAPKNKRVMAILTKALKESHSEESANHENQVQGINNKLERIQQRLKTMYDDRLDGRISVEAYDQKLEDFSVEKESLISTLNKLSLGNTQYYKLGISIHELAQRARAIYGSPKATVEERRLLLAYAFSNISVLRGKVTPEYTKAFGLLAEWMPRVNEVLEPEENGSNKEQESTFVLSHPVLLRGQDSNLQPID